MQNAVNSWRSGDWAGALDALGRGLHSIQDESSHGNWDNEHHPYTYHGADMDNWALRTDVQAEVERNTKAYLQQFIDTIRSIKKSCP